eukprot:1159227-Pelagomonas_calceolata.AAC.14
MGAKVTASFQTSLSSRLPGIRSLLVWPLSEQMHSSLSPPASYRNACRRTRARLDPEAVIELVKPEEPKESEVPFGAAFPNIEYEEPARMQDRDRQRFISLEDSQNPTSFKRDPEAPLQPRIPPPRPPSQPPPMASLVSPGLPVTADAAAAAAAAGFPAGMLLPEAMMLGGGLVAESHLR